MLTAYRLLKERFVFEPRPENTGLRVSNTNRAALPQKMASTGNTQEKVAQSQHD